MKKYIVIPVVAFLLAGVLAGASQTLADIRYTDIINPGDLVKTPDAATVYYVARNGKRYNFPNESIYRTWFGNDFSRVHVIRERDMGLLPLAGIVTYRPGSRLVKFSSEPKVYAITEYGTLRHLATPEAALQIYGPEWARMVAELPPSFAAAHTFSAPIFSVADFMQYPTRLVGAMTLGDALVAADAFPAPQPRRREALVAGILLY